MSILRRHRTTTPTSAQTDREVRRNRRAIQRALSVSPTLASRQELLAMEARL